MAERRWAPARDRLVAFGRGVVEQTVVAPVREGRIRDVGWPYGLRAVVVLGYVAFVLAAVLVVLSGPIRRATALVPTGTSGGVLLPDGAVWMLATLFSFGLSLLLVAALRSPWWLRTLAVLAVAAVLLAWSFRTPSTSGSVWWLVLSLVLLVALVVLVVLRSRRAPAWWELGAVWLVVAASLVAGLLQNRYSVSFGTDQVPLLLRYLASVLGFLVLPVATVAGASVADVCVRLTVAATEQAERLTRAWVPYAVLAVVALGRGVQVGHELATRDPVVQGWDVVVPSMVLVGLLAAAGVAVLAVARRRAARADLDGLPDELEAVALPVAVALIAVNLPIQLAVGVVPLLAPLAPGLLTGVSFDPAALVGRLVDPIRALVGVVLLVLAFRSARRGRATRALVQATIGVVLVALARTLIQGPQVRAGIDPDLLDLVATAVVVVGGLVALLRRRLTRLRALTLAGALTLCALFSSRDFISDPVGALLGFSGAALVLFGLCWDLFTGSDWANGDSRRFPRPTRVLLVLASSVTTMSVLAFAALVRDGSTTIYLDPYASFGDYLFGTALLAAAVIAVLVPAEPVAAISSGSSTSQAGPGAEPPGSAAAPGSANRPSAPAATDAATW